MLGDQDHAVVYDSADDSHGHFFAELAEFVVGGLELAGIPRCPSNVMAIHPAFCQPMVAWLDRLQEWMAADERQVFFSEIILDYRKVAGPLDELIPDLDRIARSARQRPLFLRRLARLAIQQRPPVGLFGNLSLEGAPDQTSVLDIKTSALLPITEMARYLALEMGIAVPGTYERLRRVAKSESPAADLSRSLEEAFRYLQEIRFRHQARHVESGGTIDNLIDPSELGELEQRQLKDSLRVVRRVQGRLGYWLDLSG